MSKKISQLEEKQELTGNEFVALQDGTDNKKAKVSALTALAGLPAFVLSGDLAGGNGVISSAVWERLMAARTANSPIVVINDNGSLPVANVAILGFGSNEQQQGTTDIIMPARVNDLSDYTVTQTVYQITGSGSTYNIATVTKNLKFYNSGDGTKFLANDGTYKEVAGGMQYLDFSMFTGESGTLSDEDYNKIVDAYNNKVVFGYLGGRIIPININYNDNIYHINFHEIISNTTSFGIYSSNLYAYFCSVRDSDKTYDLFYKYIVIDFDGNGTKFLSDDGTYKEISAGGVSVVEHGTADTTFTLTPNVLHKWGEVATLTLTLAAETSGVLNEYMFQFTSGTTPTVLTLPETVKWIGESTVEASKTYQVSIVNNLAVLGGA